MRAVIPRRSTLAGDRGVLIVNYAMHKQKTLFFFLLQARTAVVLSCCPAHCTCICTLYMISTSAA